MPGQVVAIHVYPVKGEPGVDLDDTAVDAEGLRGDRRKRAAVHLVASQDLTPDLRANFVVSCTPDALLATIGTVLRVGVVELAVTGPAGTCPGVYAAVAAPGAVRVGDLVVAAHHDGDGTPGVPR